MGKKPLSITEMAREGEKARAAKLNKDSKIERKGTASRWPKKRAAK
jgi:hypothetical protein